MCDDFQEPDYPAFHRGIRNGILLSIPLWGVIIMGIIAIKGAFSHG